MIFRTRRQRILKPGAREHAALDAYLDAHHYEGATSSVFPPWSRADVTAAMLERHRSVRRGRVTIEDGCGNELYEGPALPTDYLHTHRERRSTISPA